MAYYAAYLVLVIFGFIMLLWLIFVILLCFLRCFILLVLVVLKSVRVKIKIERKLVFCSYFLVHKSVQIEHNSLKMENKDMRSLTYPCFL